MQRGIGQQRRSARRRQKVGLGGHAAAPAGVREKQTLLHTFSKPKAIAHSTTPASTICLAKYSAEEPVEQLLLTYSSPESVRGRSR